MSVSDHYQQNESLSLSKFNTAQIDFEEERKEHKLENNKLLEINRTITEGGENGTKESQTRKVTATEGRGTIETVN